MCTVIIIYRYTDTDVQLSKHRIKKINRRKQFLIKNIVSTPLNNVIRKLSYKKIFSIYNRQDSSMLLLFILFSPKINSVTRDQTPSQPQGQPLKLIYCLLVWCSVFNKYRPNNIFDEIVHNSSVRLLSYPSLHPYLLLNIGASTFLINVNCHGWDCFFFLSFEFLLIQPTQFFVQRYNQKLY